MKVIYRCEYDCKIPINGMYGEICTARAKSLDLLKDGFWINDSFKFTQTSKAKYWIPPSAIRYISKDNQP